MTSKNVIDKQRVYRLFRTVCITSFLVVVTFCIMMKSPQNYWRKGIPGTDSSVFQYIAMVMKNGGVPYRDTFDHKGPLLFFINWVGICLDKYYGIWLVEGMLMFTSIVLIYKIARMRCKIFFSCVTVLASTALFNVYFEGGNFCEEYAIPFLLGALYIFIDYFKNGIIGRKRLVLCGLCFGAVLLLRPNMISVWIVFCLTVLVDYFQRERKFPVQFLVWFLVGTMICLVPVLLWLGVNGALGQFVRDYLIFNVKYSENANDALVFSVYNAGMFFLDEPIVVVVSVLVLFLAIRKNHDSFDIGYFIYYIMTFALMVMSGNSYRHYGMVLIPAFVYPLSYWCSLFEEDDQYNKQVMLVTVGLGLLFFSNWKSLVDNVVNVFNSPHATMELNEDMEEIQRIVEQNTQQTDTIQVLGNKNFYYLLCNRTAASRYSYQIPIMKIDESICEKVIDDMRMNDLPMVIANYEVICEYKEFWDILDEYELVYSGSDGMNVYQNKK